MKPIITCFGETLWDVLPTSRQPGGAPMNVAADLRNLSVNAQLISRVGNDTLGYELLHFLDEKQLPLDLIQISQTHPTGIAQANVTDAQEVAYTIAQPAAWDYIFLEPTLLHTAEMSTFFVYGSLAARSPQTLETLLALLEVAPRNVFDVNLRSPHYQRAVVEKLLQQAHIVKLNEPELNEIASWYSPETDLLASMQQLRYRYQLAMLCVTLGEKGAALLSETGFWQQPGFPVAVEDTIGSGDAFLAAFLQQLLSGVSPPQSLRFACAAGAYVASKRGATPSFSINTINQLIKQSPNCILNQ